MDTILAFFSDLILFSAGIVVALIWVVLLVIVADEIIDLFVDYRNKKEGNNE